MTITTIPLHDDRETTYTVQTVQADGEGCTHGHGSCGKPGTLAVRCTLEQQRPVEETTQRITVCAEHQDGAARMHAAWVASARELQDPIARAGFLASAGITD